jgi:hypothetical protein
MGDRVLSGAPSKNRCVGTTRNIVLVGAGSAKEKPGGLRKLVEEFQARFGSLRF